MFQQLTLRTSLIFSILTMGMLGIGLALFVDYHYRDKAVISQQQALKNVVRLRVEQALANMVVYSRNFAQTIQYDKNIGAMLIEEKNDALERFIADSFNLYLTSSGIIKIVRVVVHDINFQTLVMVNKGNNQSSQTSCPNLIADASRRQGAQRLRISSQLCLNGGRPYMHVLLPIGGLHPKGYLEVVSDPVMSLAIVEKELGLPVTIRLANGYIAFQSKEWPRNQHEMLDNSVVAEHQVVSDTGKAALKVMVLRDIEEYSSNLDSARWGMLLMIVLVTCVMGMIIWFFIKRSTVRPLLQLNEKLWELEQDQSQLGSLVDIQGNREVTKLAQGFNHLTRTLKELYDELHHTNNALKAQIKEREVKEIELKNSRDHLEQQVDKRTMDLALARDVAMRANQTKSQFLASMSHELRTPLNAIIGYTELLLDERQYDDDEHLKEDLRKIYVAARHLLALIKDILDLSKVEAGKIDLELEEFDIYLMVRELEGAVRPLVEKNKNTFEVDCSEKIGVMYADVTKLRQTLLNLLSNAAKFTAEGSVQLSVRRVLDLSSEVIIFSVTDTGVGLTRDEITRIFEPFTQADSSTTRKYGGTGLGLAISRNFARLMGGDITASAEEGKGAKFTLRLPLRVKEFKVGELSNSVLSMPEEQPDPRAQRIARPLVEHDLERRQRVVGILLINQNPMESETVVNYLKKKGFEVFVAYDMQSGQKIAARNRPGVVLIDSNLCMQDLDEFRASTLQIMANNPIYSICLVEEATVKFVDGMGFNTCLGKPIELEKLYHLIQQKVRVAQQNGGLGSWQVN